MILNDLTTPLIWVVVDGDHGRTFAPRSKRKLIDIGVSDHRINRGNTLAAMTTTPTNALVVHHAELIQTVSAPALSAAEVRTVSGG